MQLRFMLFLGVVLAGAAIASPAQKTPGPSSQLPAVQSGPVAPSDSGAASAPGYDSSQSSQHVGVSSASRNTPNSLRASEASGAISGTASTLCFEPGAGWVRVPQVAGPSNGNGANAPAGSVSGARGRGATSTRARVSPCPSQWSGATAARRAEPSQDSGLTGTAQDKLTASGLSAPGAAATYSGSLGTGSLSPASLSQGQAASFKRDHPSSASSEPAGSDVDSLSTRAYVSPIRLRRMLRSAPDLQTRLKLRNLNRKATDRSSRKHAASRQSETQAMESQLAAGGQTPRSSSDRRSRKNKRSRSQP